MSRSLSSTRFWEIFRFALVGGGCFLLEYCLLYILTEYAGLHYLWSSAIAFVVSLLVNYWLCVAIVFRGAKRQSGGRRALFIGSSIAGLGINQACMWALVDKLGMYYMIAKLFTSAIVMVWNYILKRKAVAGQL